MMFLINQNFWKGELMENYIMETEQLALRELTMNDFQSWHNILSD